MSAGTKVSAPTMQPAPTTARSITTAFIPMSALRPNVRAVNDRAVANVRPGLEANRYTGKDR